ncbi:hypothetical protein [Isoptericola sp. BMS4]|uniref:hypothetical protein n=1 Tax=Isoptericola sp. BMS4 TaxID=2527875 RepID=UPI0014224338|nr:hypothetical protein [Isoptericola sp. BMS4]
MPTDALIPVPADAAARDLLLGRVRTLAALDHPRVEPVGAPAVRPDGRLAVPRGPGVVADLPTLLTVRGRLAPPEVGELLVGLAQGLAALHSAGLAHGRVEAGDVGLAADGAALLRPRLEHPGMPGDGPEAACAEDVHGLAALADELLGTGDGDDVVALRAVLAPALAPDARVRPEAGTLAAQAAGTVPPEPVRMPERAQLVAAALGAGSGTPRGGDAREPQPSRSSRRGTRERAVARRPRRTGGEAPAAAGRGRRNAGRRRGGGRRHVPGVVPRLAGAAGVLALVAVLAAVALQVRQPDPPDATAPATPAAGPKEATASAAAPADTESSAGSGGRSSTGSDSDTVRALRDRTDPAGAAAALTEHRVALLSGTAEPPGVPDPAEAMARVDLAGSPAHDADVALLADLAGDGTTVHDVGVEVLGTRVTGSGDGTASVVVDYEIGAHEQRTADGATTSVAASGPRRVELELAWTGEGWRVSDVG